MLSSKDVCSLHGHCYCLNVSVGLEKPHKGCCICGHRILSLQCEDQNWHPGPITPINKSMVYESKIDNRLCVCGHPINSHVEYSLFYNSAGCNESCLCTGFVLKFWLNSDDKK